MAEDCEKRGIQHDWRRHSTQSGRFYWKCERCGKESVTDRKPEN